MNKKSKTTLTYFFVVLLTILVISMFCLLGEQIFKPSLVKVLTTEKPSQPSDLLFHLLLALTVIVTTAKIFGIIFEKFKQPAVMGEVIAGIVLGPSFLGSLSPDLLNFILPSNLAPILNMIAQLGVIIFMFLVGVNLDTNMVKNKGHASIAISHASILFPFVLGALSSFLIYPRFAPQDVTFSVFTVFMGVSLSVTAFPVLARILKDLKIADSSMAALVITCAAVDDITAWGLLAFAIGLAQANLFSVFLTFMLSMAFFFLMLKLAPSMLKKIAHKIESVDSESTAMTWIVIGILMTALCTEYIGIHALFGPFLLGALIPKKSFLAETVRKKFESITLVLLLPVFFAFTGMRTQINLIHGVDQWLWCFFLIAMASLGKIGGASLVARYSGIAWRDAFGIGVLMNTRGLMELIVLNIGLDLKIISPTLFTMLVIMAVVTTLMTCPLFSLITKKDSWAQRC